jgi:hypothetical protein
MLALISQAASVDWTCSLLAVDRQVRGEAVFNLHAKSSLLEKSVDRYPLVDAATAFGEMIAQAHADKGGARLI